MEGLIADLVTQGQELLQPFKLLFVFFGIICAQRLLVWLACRLPGVRPEQLVWAGWQDYDDDDGDGWQLPAINPASGLPMVGDGIGGVDVRGNAYGLSGDDDWLSSCDDHGSSHHDY